MLKIEVNYGMTRQFSVMGLSPLVSFYAVMGALYRLLATEKEQAKFGWTMLTATGQKPRFSTVLVTAGE